MASNLRIFLFEYHIILLPISIQLTYGVQGIWDLKIYDDYSMGGRILNLREKSDFLFNPLILDDF